MDALVKPENDSLNRNVRRYEVRLKVTATGILILAFWGIVRDVMMTIMNRNGATAKEVKELFKNMNNDEMFMFTLAAIAFLLLLFFLDTLFRVRIFQLARRESRDPSVPKKKSYLVMAVLLIMGNIYSIVHIGLDIYKGEYKALDGVISVVIEITSLLTLIELIHSAVKLRQLRDKQKLVRKGTQTGSVEDKVDNAETEDPVKEAAVHE